MATLDNALKFCEQHRDRFVEELKAFCAIPSISTLPEHEGDVARAADWLVGQLRSLGMSGIEIMPTGGHPVVYAEWLRAPGRPTVLVYGHYDVQPVDPIDEWNTPPFEPTIQGDCLYARGASDMKAQTLAHLKALEALASVGEYPVNLKFLLEGEEEVGSPHLAAFVDAHRDLLECDFILNCDGGIHAVDVPSITYGLRGLAYFELEVRGPASDLHSGVFGGAVHNPAQALCELVAGMHDDHGRITLPGFYDAVRALSDEERDTLARVPLPDDQWLALTGAPGLWGEEGYSILERIGARPTLDVNGIGSGFTGAGSKTVLPARAMAKISMRLVPDQDPSQVADQLRAYLEQRAPASISWELREMVHASPAIMERDSTWMRAAAKALEDVFGVPPAYKRDGGTIPVISVLKEKLGVDSVLLGFELPDAGFHGPNEKMHLPSFHRGIEVYVRFMLAL